MAPEREDRLFAAVKEVGEKVDKVAIRVEIMGRDLKASREEIRDHRLILSGRPGNSDSSGLTTRVEVLENTQETVAGMQGAAAKEREKYAKWFRKQLAAVILALLGTLGLQGYGAWNGKAPASEPAETDTVVHTKGE